MNLFVQCLVLLVLRYVFRLLFLEQIIYNCFIFRKVSTGPTYFLNGHYTHVGWIFLWEINTHIQRSQTVLYVFNIHWLCAYECNCEWVYVRKSECELVSGWVKEWVVEWWLCESERVKEWVRVRVSKWEWVSYGGKGSYSEAIPSS